MIFMIDLAFAGRWARNTRHVLPGLLNGLKDVVTSVMNFVSMAVRMQGASLDLI